MLTQQILRKNIILFVCLFGASATSRPSSDNVEAYKETIKEWHEHRVERLTSESGWLTLVGLYWLHEGKNSFGSAERNDLVFPANAPEKIGYFELRGHSVRVFVKPGLSVTIEGERAAEAALKSDISDSVTVMKNGTLSWYLIEREGRLGIRVKDSASKTRTAFRGIDTFGIDPAWRVPAKLRRSANPDTIEVPTVLGNEAKEISPGHLVFKIDGLEYQLAPLTTSDPEELFVIFGDETNGVETHGGGRFVYIDAPDASGMTFIDFNKAYNPPCAFNEFSTCPLPPPGNILPIEIRAGEKAYEE